MSGDKLEYRKVSKSSCRYYQHRHFVFFSKSESWLKMLGICDHRLFIIWYFFKDISLYFSFISTASIPNCPPENLYVIWIWDYVYLWQKCMPQNTQSPCFSVLKHLKYCQKFLKVGKTIWTPSFFATKPSLCCCVCFGWRSLMPEWQNTTVITTQAHLPADILRLRLMQHKAWLLKSAEV